MEKPRVFLWFVLLVFFLLLLLVSQLEREKNFRCNWESLSNHFRVCTWMDPGTNEQIERESVCVCVRASVRVCVRERDFCVLMYCERVWEREGKILWKNTKGNWDKRTFKQTQTTSQNSATPSYQVTENIWWFTVLLILNCNRSTSVKLV